MNPVEADQLPAGALGRLPAPDVADPPRGATEPVRKHRRLRVTEAATIFVLAAGAYLAVGAVLVFEYNTIPSDSLSRVANAFYTIYSRDPHLAALGFVWNPLPSVLMMPLLPLKSLWPSVVNLGFAANIVSSLCTAGAVVQVRGILHDIGLRPPSRLLLTGLFAAHPMVLYYGANGMTEGMFLLFLFVVVRWLCRWLQTGEVRGLVVAGIALGLAYLTRYEALAAGGGAIAMVCLVTYYRAKGAHWKDRATPAVADGAVLAAPLLACFVGWALCSWIIVGHPFDQFASVYGNSAQVQSRNFTTAADLGGASEAVVFVLRQLALLQPLFVVAGVVGLVAAVMQRNAAAVAVVGVLGSVVGFAALLSVAGRTAPWLRYYIGIVPLAVLLMAFAFVPPSPRRGLSERAAWRSVSRLRPAVVGATAVLVLGSGFVTTWAGARNSALANEEYWLLGAVLSPSDASDEQRQMRQRYDTERAVARFLDESRLRKGSVLLDSFGGFPIILASERPKQFVITSDRDFLRAVSDPAAFDVEYFLVPDKRLGDFDAVARTYPGVFQTGAGIGQLVREFGGSGPGSRWRLYRTNATAP